MTLRTIIVYFDHIYWCMVSSLVESRRTTWYFKKVNAPFQYEEVKFHGWRPKFLGHAVLFEGLKADTSKVLVVRYWPCDIHKVQSSHGLASLYRIRIFIRGFNNWFWFFQDLYAKGTYLKNLMAEVEDVKGLECKVRDSFQFKEIRLWTPDCTLRKN